MRKRTHIVGVLGFTAALAGFVYATHRSAPARVAAPAPASSVAAAAAEADAGSSVPEEDEDQGPLLRPPTGKLPMLSCADAATIVREVSDALAFPVAAPRPADFADATRNWIDPQGLWSVTPDAPPYAAVDAEAAPLLGEIERGKTCPAAMRIGRKLHAWVDSLRARWDVRRKAPAAIDSERAMTSAVDFDEGQGEPAGGAAALADDLADRAGAIERAYGGELATYVQAARDRYFPSLSDEEWGKVVLAAAVRAWVEQTDGHGAWAPYGEEATVHDVDLTKDAPTRLWARATRTMLGVRVDEGPLPPLVTGDVVLEVDTLQLAGMSVEQLDELALTAADGPDAVDATVLRAGERVPRVVRIDATAPAPAGASPHPFELAEERVPYGRGEVAVVTMTDIYDDLGELFTRALARVRSPRLAGLVLDLRGNGGGATEGAIDVLGAFLPGARLFPMRHRDGSIETDSAPAPSPDAQWTGPVATLVDGGTASAAEMLAGALAAYRRGPTVGAPTYGKGCAQEYLDDDAHAGLLRVTTLLFSLPDGSPVQRIGLKPLLPYPFHDDEVGDEREARLPHSPPSWRGPDVRDSQWVDKAAQFAWPAHGGHVGPCKDESVCRAIAMLGDSDVARARPPRGPVARTQRPLK